MSLTAKHKKALEVFYSYAHEDERLQKRLEMQLSLFRQQGLIQEWHDRKIFAGKDWKREIDTNLSTADIILLLVSPDFMASDYCYGIEVKQALERHEVGAARVIPVILRPVDWEGAPFSKLQALPTGGKPVTSRSWHSLDEAFLDIAKGVRKAIKELTNNSATASNRGVSQEAQSQGLVKNISSTSQVNAITKTSSKNPTSRSSSEELQKPKEQALPVGTIEVQATSEIFTKRESVKPRILVVDDEENIIELIKLGLKYEGLQVESASDGEEGLVAAQSIKPDLIILDWMLPGMDGLEICYRLRTNPSTEDIPILMLASKHELEDRVMGLEVGVDDYLSKPFAFEELVARIHALLRRHRRSDVKQKTEPIEGRVLQSGDIQLNMATRTVIRAGHPVELSATEYDLLYLFMSHPRRILDRQVILNRVWGYDFLGESNHIEVYVRYLREKIEDSPSAPHFIQTVQGVGYVWKEKVVEL